MVMMDWDENHYAGIGCLAMVERVGRKRTRPTGPRKRGPVGLVPELDRQ